MSNQTTQQQLHPLWRDGKNGNIQFLRIWARLQTEEPETFKLIARQVEGEQYEDSNYYYKIGKSAYGLWLSRKPKKPAATAADLVSTPTSYVENSDKIQGSTASSGSMLVVAEQLSRVAADLEELITLLKKSSLLVSNSSISSNEKEEGS